MQNNQLLNQWNNMQRQNIGYQNNALLRNNMMMKTRMEQLNYIKQMQQLRQIQLREQMKNSMKEHTKNLLTPIKIKENNKDVAKKFNERKKHLKREKYRKQIIDQHTNQEIKIDNTPYKQIMVDKKYGGTDYKKKHTKKSFNKDVVVHKVTKKDKDIKKFKEDLEQKEKKILKQDNTLKKIYSSEQEEEHKKKFEYRKTYVYRTSDNNSSTHNELKDDKIDYYEKRQKEWEKNNIKVNNIINDLKNNGILTKDQIDSTVDMIITD